MLPGCKPDYNASNFAVNARFFELDEIRALCIFSTENSFQQTTLLLLLSLQREKITLKKRDIQDVFTRDTGSSGICMACSSLVRNQA